AAEQVEVVDVERAEIDLQRAEHVRQIEPEQLRLVAIEIVVELRRRIAEGREQLLRIELRLLAGFGDHALRRLIERRTAAAGEVLDLELKAAGRAEAGDRWGAERQRDGVRDLSSFGRTEATMVEAFCSGGRWSHGLR